MGVWCGTSRGFTLIEMIMVILIAGILAIGSTTFITYSVGGYVDTARRQELATIGMIAADQISSELRNALPNSIRLVNRASGDQCLEFIPILDGSTYLTVPTAAPGATSFQAAPSGQAAATVGRIAVYPIDRDALYSQANPGPITPALATLPAGTGEVTVAWTGAHVFPTDSPSRRFFVVGTPVAFCQDGNQLFRYSNYGYIPASTQLEANLPTNIAGGRWLLLNQLATANPLVWNYTPAALTRNAVVRLTFSLVDPQAPAELVPIEHEVQIRNVP